MLIVKSGNYRHTMLQHLLQQYPHGTGVYAGRRRMMQGATFVDWCHRCCWFAAPEMCSVSDRSGHPQDHPWFSEPFTRDHHVVVAVTGADGGPSPAVLTAVTIKLQVVETGRPVGVKGEETSVILVPAGKIAPGAHETRTL